MVALREATRHRHAELEALPFVRELIDHRLPMESYVNLLRAMAIIHGVFESEIESIDDARVRAVWSPDLAKLPLLQADTDFFRPHDVPDCLPAIEAAMALADSVRCRRIEAPASLLGILYVLEGTTLGNQVHTPDVAASLQLTGRDGCRYYASYGDNVVSHWARFSQTMNRAIDDPERYDAIVDGALEAFAGLERILAALFPFPRQPNAVHATRINPEAGNHAMPSDPREMKAALRASRLAWAEFPYLEHRFGKRGKRFSDSDACWLTTLERLDPVSLQRQIDWLRRVLSSRGMPSLMLERTLVHLHHELEQSIPENHALHEKLRTEADRLRGERLEGLSAQNFEALSQEFERLLGPELSAAYPNTGVLLLSAVADEQHGIEQAVDSFRAWAAEAGRFPEPWTASVDWLIDQGRSRARP